MAVVGGIADIKTIASPLHPTEGWSHLNQVPLYLMQLQSALFH